MDYESKAERQINKLGLYENRSQVISPKTKNNAQAISLAQFYMMDDVIWLALNHT